MTGFRARVGCVWCAFSETAKEKDLTQRSLRPARRGRREEEPRSTARNHPAKFAGWGGGGCAAWKNAWPLKVAATITSLRGSCSFCFGRRARFSVGRNNRLTRLRRVHAGRSGFPALRATVCFRRG